MCEFNMYYVTGVITLFGEFTTWKCYESAFVVVKRIRIDRCGFS